MKKQSQREEILKYRIGNRKKEHSIPVAEILKRFSKSKEAENYTKYYYPFNVCIYRFLMNEIEGLQKLSEGQYSSLKERFDSTFKK